ncbi:type IX secretion system periplasmic lipoprotein PorW/SprE [Fulvivirga ligni]|uniref:type IX secretion system periplasmic lipoprotein PorW/SprE n=1 Tax=Fulvivirga ligni TaxID=2904246 RepID=UPI001F330112|nr:tetratricopeptide repeat protein [Fulvivirga ligni]UII22038.1 tetratricopeptide repeat protein [Fulvivirga ligni]
MLHPKIPFFACITLLSFLAGCSAERNNVISKTYHNTTARYNAYFYAKNDIREVKDIVRGTYDNDYNRVLKIYPEIDSVLADSYKEQIEDCIKKSSLVVQRHKNSKWVDDSYVLIGLARFYSLDYVNAIETFKYVNTKSEDDNTRHLALAHLHRTFTDYEEYNNAIAVSDYLKKEKINKESAKVLYLNQAHYYQVQGDLDNMVRNLVKAAPLLKKSDGKGRIYFIIGQIYQDLGFDSEAYNYYKKCIASNPEYELDFYARLYMAQVTELGKSSDLRAARKHFKKLLSDRKNKEFKDKIYYEMAEFELRQGNIDGALDYLKSSVASSTDNNRQKGQSYLRIGQIEYDSLAQYELAKLYYDSAVKALPTDFENYEKIKQRQEVLADFVTQINTIQLQDSLLELASLDSVSIMNRIDDYLAQEAEKKKKEEKRQEQAQKRRQFDLRNSDSGIGATSWYFGNPSAVAMGQTEFQRIWGDRALEDNWRLSSVQSGAVPQDAPSDVATNVDIVDGVPEEGLVQDAPAENRAAQMYSQIPFSEEAKGMALGKIEEAYYKLGNIYYFNLEELKNASETFDKLLTRFPESTNEPEVLYQMYLIGKELGTDTEKYKNELLTKYPNTTYAKLIANPNYTEESTAANEQLKIVYKDAYALFREGDYAASNNMIDSALNKFPETVFTPRLRLLKILIVGKTENINLYQYQLSEFIKKNPDSDITPYAQELLDASKNFQKKQQRLLGTKYVEYFEQEHYFIFVYESGKGLADELSSQVEAYNDNQYTESELKTSNLILDDRYDMVMVAGFTGKVDAQKYYNQFIKNKVIFEDSKNSKFYKFVITKDNFNIFYQSKDLDAYLGFFNKYYTNGL